MDFLSIFGLVLAFVAITGSQYIDGGDLSVLLNGPAIIIVLGGTVGAVMLQTPIKEFKRAFSILKWVIKPPKLIFSDAIRKIIRWSNQTRKLGLMALEESLEKEHDGFAKKGLNILSQGSDALTLRRVMEVELELLELRELKAARVFESMGGYSPTIGIIGAVLGLIDVMKNLTVPSELGAGIAVAFVATIYGVGLANLIFLPVSNKLKNVIFKRSQYREMILEGLISVAHGEHPVIIKEKLQAFLRE